MTAPWNMMEQLQNWSSLLQDHIDKLPISAEQMQEYQRRSLYRWQTYTEPGDEIENSLGGSPTKRPSRTVMDTGDELEPAPGSGIPGCFILKYISFQIQATRTYWLKQNKTDLRQRFAFVYNLEIFKDIILVQQVGEGRLHRFPSLLPQPVGPVIGRLVCSPP